MSKPVPGRRVAALIPLICHLARNVCARRRMVSEEREDFESFLFATLLERDCRVFERFRGDGSLANYLRAVIGRLLLDYRVHKWGKWRPSAQATRLGDVAIELERLIEREGFSRMEAIRHLRINLGVERSEQALLDLAEQLPNRPQRRFVGGDTLSTLPGANSGIERPDRCATAELTSLVRSGLARALAELDPAAKRLIDQRFTDGLSVAEIARRSGDDQWRLYRILERILGDLRSRLEALGIDRAMVRSLLESAG